MSRGDSMDIKALYESKKGTVDDALGAIRSNDVVVMAGEGNCPVEISKAFHKIAPKVTGVKVFKDFTHYFPFPTMDEVKGHIFTQGFFFGKDMREGLPKGNSSYFPSDICNNDLFINKNNPTVFIAASTLMDEEGNFQISLCNMWEPGTLEYVKKNKGRIILEVNKNLPKIHGALEVNIKDVFCLIETDSPITEIPAIVASDEEKEVAANVRKLIKDGDCLQFGIGALPNAIADLCMDLTDIGIHTEMLTTAMAKMVREGVATGKKKNFNPGKHIFTFAGGDQSLFKTLNGNDDFIIVPASWGCDPFIISKNDNMVSVNTCIEMDLMGQIASEAIGTKQYSGSGGALCYAYGAMRSKGGRGIMAFTSKTSKGYSKIKPVLSAGSSITIPRNYADYIVTEYGSVQLRGKNLKERAQGLISIAHPDFREELEKEAKKLMWL